MIEITLHSPGGHTSRPHLTGDLVYGLGTLITGLPGVLSRRIDPAQRHRDGLGARSMRGLPPNAIPQTGVLAGKPSAPPAVKPGWASRTSCGETVAALLSPLGIEHSLRYKPRRSAGWSTRKLRHASSPTPSRRSARMRCAIPDSPVAVRISPGIWRKYLVRWPALGLWSGDGPQLDLHQADVRPRRAWRWPSGCG